MVGDGKLSGRMGCMVPTGPGIFEIHHMGRRMKVHVNRDGSGELKVFGVPGHMEDGLPLTDFDGYAYTRIDDPRRSHTSNLSIYDRAVSRTIASLTALRAVIMDEEFEKETELFKKATAIDNLTVQIAVAYKTVTDRDGVEKAVAERMDAWAIEDRDGLPLPSYGPGAPPEGRDVNGRNV